MAILVANNATSYLAGTLTAVATSLTVSSGTGTLFPTISGSDVFYVTLTNTSNQNEIVKVTAKATDTFTIVRAQDGTSALAFAIGDKVELRVIKVVFDDKASLTNDQTFSGANVFSGSGTTDLVRITQAGTGNAFVVEDSTNPDATPFVIDASGSVVRGYTSSVASDSSTGVAATPSIQNHGLSVSGSSYGAFTWVASAVGPNFIFSKSRGATAGTNAVVSDSDLMGGITFAGDDGTTFITGAAITGAVDGTPGNNDMPGRLVFSTTADGASTPTERMRITSTGNVGIGTSAITTAALRVSNGITGGTIAQSIRSDGAIQSDVTGSAYYFISSANMASGTLNNLFHYAAIQGTIGATVTNQSGFYALGSLIGATNNYSFIAADTAAITAGKTSYGYYSAVNTATGGGTTYGFYANGTAPNYFNGNVGIGTTSLTSMNLRVTKAITGSTTAVGIRSDGAIQTDVTATGYYFSTSANMASGTIGTITHYGASQGTIGATVTNQSGFSSDATLIGATNNYAFLANDTAGVTAGKTAYGFHSAVNTATGGGTTYGFYASGTAVNYFGGNVGIGTNSPTRLLTLSSSGVNTRVQINNTVSGKNFGLYAADDGNSTINYGTSSDLLFTESGTERMRINSSGNVGIGETNPTRKLDVVGTAAATYFMMTSNTASAPAVDAAITRPADGTLALITNSAERMRIDSSGNLAIYQPTQTSKSAAATLTAAELQARIIQYTGAAATLTLPTGTNLESVIASGQAVNTAFDITFIHTGTGTLTIGANGNTTVGTLTLATLTSATFRFRKTATNTFTIYRL